MMDWERDDLVKNMGNNLNQCERAVQERMLWHFFMVHDDYEQRVDPTLYRPDILPTDDRRIPPVNQFYDLGSGTLAVANALSPATSKCPGWTGTGGDVLRR